MVRPSCGSDDPVKSWTNKFLKVLLYFTVPPDQVFDQIDTTEDVYEKFAKPVIESAMLGFNG
jgi:hypothetical protein